MWSKETRGKEIQLVTFVKESKGVAASILEKGTWVGEGGTNAARWSWQSREHSQFSHIGLVGSKFGNH